MNKDYLPFYNGLNEKEKAFWLECSKEELIDHLIANIINGEILLQRIDKAIEYIKENIDNTGWLEIGTENVKELLEILGGDNNGM